MSGPLQTRKLTAGEVAGLKARIARGESTVRREADRYEVSVETIRRALRGDTYRHVRAADPWVGCPANQTAQSLHRHPGDAASEAFAQEGEPTAEEAEASLERLARLLADSPQAKAEALIREMTERGGRTADAPQEGDGDGP